MILVFLHFGVNVGSVDLYHFLHRGAGYVQRTSEEMRDEKKPYDPLKCIFVIKNTEANLKLVTPPLPPSSAYPQFEINYFVGQRNQRLLKGARCHYQDVCITETSAETDLVMCSVGGCANKVHVQCSRLVGCHSDRAHPCCSVHANTNYHPSFGNDRFMAQLSRMLNTTHTVNGASCDVVPGECS